MNLIFTIISYSQDYKFAYYLNEELSSTEKKNAVFIGKGKYVENKFQLDCFKKINNSLLMSIQFVDSSLGTMNGTFISYYENGLIENNGFYKNNLEEGIWLKLDTTGLLTDSLIYTDGILINHSNFTYFNKKISTASFTDTLKNTYSYISYDSIGNKTIEANFVADTGTLITMENGQLKKTAVFTRKLEEAKCSIYPDYLRKNLNPIVAANNGAPAGIHTVIIKFKVDTLGKVYDVIAETHKGFGMEQEAIRVIKNSPIWSPANLFGKLLIADRRQPISFYISIDK